MTERLIGPTGSPKRRRFLFVPTLMVVALSMFWIAGAQAVHDENFQLDGDVTASTTTNYGGTIQAVDWDSLFNADGTEKPLPTDFTASGFDRDFVTSGTTFVTSDTTTFATGSKDTLPISGWQCNFDNNVNSKIDVMNSYAAEYIDPVSGDEILYFGLERNVNTGDANVGFWFLQDAVGCETTGGAVTFTGDHTDGDLLIVSAFSNGGTVSTINVYRWNGGADGSLGQTPVASGVDCRDATVTLNDLACGTANTAPITTPWLTAAKTTVGNTLPTAQFFEGGLNLTDANLAGKCFNTFLGDTRSSTSLTATLFDYSLGVLGDCESGILTTPQTGAGADITAPLSIGTAARVEVRDKAVITVDGTDGPFDGTVKFYLCGPLALDSTSNCSTGGVQIGDPAAGEAVSGSAGTATVYSDTATLTSAGRYCWRGEYSGDPDVGVPASSDPEDTTNVSECFSVNPVQPTLTTTAGADVTLGNPITDTATLAGTAKQPGTDGVGPGGTINATAGSQLDANGSITWTVRGPGNCDASGLTVTGSPATVSGDGMYGPVSALPTAIGTYTFVASYDGDSPNTLGASGSCPPAAGDGDEEVTVTGTAALSTAQDWLPNDTATLTGDTNLTGTLTFQLYTGDNCGATSGSAVAGQLYTVPVSNAASGSTFSTSNTTFKVKAADSGNYSWLVTYDDANLEDPDPECETTAITITD